ncbi:hypothetical protein P8C59_004424 [Phyllachora maydis]|uniref:Uncharacterized protein n=1 Tax=Phyllachora maydis TaxID=1825666 RepID=A0AAD9I3D6_9PEZI|nr:hypothetical protein P8C59_004424 [Phyllachora maydis]
MSPLPYYLVAALVGLPGLADGHMFINSPVPIPGSAPKDPLDGSGANFPCHGVALPSTGGISMKAGSSQLLSWELNGGENTAVHGGGSCELSITYETDPVKVKDPSNWKVIYAIEEDCMSNTYQNLDAFGAKSCSDPSTNGVDCVNSFNYTIPRGVKDGNAVLAWTWFNTVGNREMYMNCANVAFTGGDGSELDEMPAMFVANLAAIDSCPTTQSVHVAFPHPGKYVFTKTPTGPAAATAKTYPLATPTGPGCPGDGGAAATPTPAAAGLSVTAASQGSDPGAAPTAASTSPSAAVPTSTRSTSSGSSGRGTASGSCGSGEVACSSGIVCIGSSQFGLCDDGCAIPQALAAGTSCRGGVIGRRYTRRKVMKPW